MNPDLPALHRIRFEQIDALRGAAALLVLLHHAWVHAGGYPWPVLHVAGYTWEIFRVYSYTYIGVDLFLVLSGFCLAYPYYNNAQRTFRWREYVWRRFWRIYPPYFLVFAFLLLLGWLVRRGGGPPVPTMFAERLSWTQLIGGLTLQTTQLNASFWSLCLELRWYLLFPFVLLWALRTTALHPLVVTLILSALVPDDIRGPGKVPIYLPVFVAGLWAAEITARPERGWHRSLRRWAWLGFAAFVVLACFFLPGALSPGRGGFREAWLTGSLFFFLVLGALEHGWHGWPVRLLAVVGGFSYTLYLIHEPVIHGLWPLVHSDRWPDYLQWVFWQGVVVSGIVLLAALLSRGIERPFLQVKRQKPDQPLLAAVKAGIVQP